MIDTSEVVGLDKEFFSALLTADAAKLDGLLANDFILVDVMQGAEISKAMLLDVVGSRQLQFLSIEPLEGNVRHYGDAAVVIGRTRMLCQFGTDQFTVDSRYTHVFSASTGEWRLVSAQGTQIQASAK